MPDDRCNAYREFILAGILLFRIITACAPENIPLSFLRFLARASHEKKRMLPSESRCSTEHEISVHTKSSRADVKGRETFHSDRDDKANLHRDKGNQEKDLALWKHTIPVFLPSIERGDKNSLCTSRYKIIKT